ncbi:hypothetical protein [Tautonia sociabilis]|uniref:Squalene cyclase C-terminal domain-containing protein n=1 Tax=Tautonia sociabilis TaxID=2080755 RepID=A0A432MPX8_9BACT|nr:hypothetical protein [Tautonia sociabilis]RUL89524.1 hypothetical protein TsocGM_01775 [Tautonia sociabilis]
MDGRSPTKSLDPRSDAKIMAVRPRLAPPLVLALLAAWPVPEATGQAALVARGIDFLKNRGPAVSSGEAALAALAMLKAGVPKDDEALGRTIQKALSRSRADAYIPERSGGTDIYETGVACMMLANLDPVTMKPLIQSAASYLISKQKSNGAWDYDNRGGDTGDCSISQYALLGLWEAENAGVKVPPSVWERAARWYMSVQRGGGWTYHPDAGTAPTVSMTAAGTGSLLICKMQLAVYRQKQEKPISPLLTPLVPETDLADYRVGLSEADLDRAIGQGIAWIARNYRPGQAPLFGPSSYYGLYGCERVGGLSGLELFGSLDWFRVGGQYIASTQGGDGSWHAQYDPVANTSWSLLFLTRATQKTMDRIRVERLASGTLLGGRGLPENLESLTVAQGRVVVRPMNGAVDEMLAVLEDARLEGTEEALAGLIDRYFSSGPLALRPYTDRFRVLLEDGIPSQRLTAAWALARTDDLDVVPDLIAALEDPSDEVVATARYGLKLLSRRLDGFGPPPGADALQKREAARRWREWYESVRPASLSDQAVSPRNN